MDQNWDLLAVVRGGNINNNKSNNIMESPTTCFVPRSINQANGDVFYANYPHLFETTTALDELEDLCKPFYPVLQPPLPSPSSTLLTSSISLPKPAEFRVPRKIKNVKEPATKYKKRKNQQKRVVKQVKEDGLCTDMWAWRKYGQKPIKGSPYPRSYYRCSSSKGCSARKQVERSPSNPEIFIITYTAEHSHAHPTRRNSLAGSTRSRFPLSKASQLDHDDHKSSSTASDHHDHLGNIELVQKESTKRENEEAVGKNNSEITGIPNHDQNQMFWTLEELERGLLEELDEETFNKESLIMDSEFLNQGFADASDFLDHADWFFDHYSATLTGAY